jgi:energy-coupling factor transporter transmembrane protein EcfT
MFTLISLFSLFKYIIFFVAKITKAFGTVPQSFPALRCHSWIFLQGPIAASVKWGFYHSEDNGGMVVIALFKWQNFFIN